MNLTLEESIIEIIQKCNNIYGFKKLETYYTNENIKFWIDDKITILFNNKKIFSNNLSKENIQRADLYLHDLVLYQDTKR